MEIRLKLTLASKLKKGDNEKRPSSIFLAERSEKNIMSGNQLCSWAQEEIEEITPRVLVRA